MQTPLIVQEGPSNLYLFKTRRSAETSLEAIDVRNNEYVAYDATGKKLRLSVEKEQGWIFSREFVRISANDDDPCDSDELSRVVRSFLIRTGTSSDLVEDVPLSTLIKMVSPRCMVGD